MFMVNKKKMITAAVFVALAAAGYFLMADTFGQRGEPVKVAAVEEEKAEESAVYLKKTGDKIKVYVTGAVKTPDSVVILKEGCLIIDAVNAAGGLHKDADVSGIDLDKKLDGNTTVNIPFRSF